MVVKTSPHLHLGLQPHVAGFTSLGVGGPSPGLGICRHTTVTVSRPGWLPQQHLLRLDLGDSRQMLGSMICINCQPVASPTSSWRGGPVAQG